MMVIWMPHLFMLVMIYYLLGPIYIKCIYIDSGSVNCLYKYVEPSGFFCSLGDCEELAIQVVLIKISLVRKKLNFGRFSIFYVDLILRIQLMPNIKFSVRINQFFYPKSVCYLIIF